MPAPPSASPIPVRAIVVGTLTLIAAGLLSVSFGQDANWDLLNYHLYNPWAFLTGRLDLDLAVAGVPSYVNPLIDLPYYALIDRLPPRVLAFLMGAVQGADALLIYRLITRLVPNKPMTSAFLALGGVTGSVFLSEFGNTMGDNVTAAFLLAALILVVDERLADGLRRKSWDRILLAGVVAGLGTGLKLTNAPYAVGLLAVLAASGPTHARWRAGLKFASGCAVGFAASYGFWAVTLWKHFANPFFPQFNRLFGSPLAAATVVADDKWHPQTWVEAVLFPFVFTAFPMRINEVPLVDPMWPVVYVCFLAWLTVVMVRRFTGARHPTSVPDLPQHDAETALLIFAGVAYLLWMTVFSIGRYLVLLELLLPVLAWLLMRRLLPPRPAARLCVALIAAASAFTVFVGFRTWGNAPFEDLATQVDVPALTDPSHTTMLVLTAPIAWILPSFPAETAFMALDLGFPDSPGYLERVHASIAGRGGPVFALLPVERETQRTLETVLNPWMARHGIRRDGLPCRYVAAIFDNQPGSDVLLDESGSADGCRFRRDIEQLPLYDRGAATIARALAQHGFSIDLERCTFHDAAIGANRYRYRFCPVARKASN